MLQAIEDGGALFNMGINFMIANWLCSNPHTNVNLLTFAPNPDPLFKTSKNIIDLLPLLHVCQVVFVSCVASATLQYPLFQNEDGGEF